MLAAARAYTLAKDEGEQLQYGVKAVRKLRQVRRTDLLSRGPTSRQNQRKEEVFEYFRQKVDPIIQECVTFLVCSQPEDTCSIMYDFMVSWRDNKKNNFVLPVNTPKTTQAQRQYLAHEISPIITHLVGELSKSRPDDVQSFICDQLLKMKHAREAAAANKPPKTREVHIVSSNGSTTHLNPVTPVRNIPRPSTTESVITSPRQANGEHHHHHHHHGHGNNNQMEDKKMVRPESAPTIGVAPKPQVQEIQIALLGVGGAGKSSLINTLQGKDNCKVRPTMGFRPVTMMLGDEIKLRFYDLGGGPKIREIWEQYYHDVHGYIYMIDSTASHEVLKESADVYHKVSEHEFLRGKPALVLANKQDIPGALGVETLDALLQASSRRNTVIKECHCFSSVEGNVDEDTNVFQIADPRAESSLIWLLDVIRAQYADINVRVHNDTAKMEMEEAKKKALKERSVLRNKIATAFADQIDKSVDVNICANPNDLFGPIDGPKFLANEVGVDIAILDPIAIEVAHLVGNQRLALQMLGALNVPISKKKAPLSWTAIRDLVCELRVELGLPSRVEIPTV